MIGAIAGDIIGSIHEGAGTKTKQFPLFGPYVRFTDDTVLTIAVAESILRCSSMLRFSRLTSLPKLRPKRRSPCRQHHSAGVPVRASAYDALLAVVQG